MHNRALVSKQRLRPSPLALRLLLGLGFCAFFGALIEKQWLQWGALADLPLLALFILVSLFGIDYFATRKQTAVTMQRKLPSGLALNQWVTVQLKLDHSFTQPKWIAVFDGLPNDLIAEGAQSNVLLQIGRHSILEYRLRPLRRGELRFEQCHIQIRGPMGLWLQCYAVAAHSESKVYPDFAAITAYTLLASENHTSQLGIRTRSRRGLGLNFHQLREYRQGDSLRQLDWNATAKRQQLISKEYQDERDQNVVLLIDSGRRMRSQDGELNHFDQALNASILLSYIALRQGDSVAVMSFGQQERWIPAQKGSDRVKVILNGLYDLQADNTAPDYLFAAQRLSSLQQKRSLVIVLTNCRDEETDELKLAMKLLQKRHLVLLANLREQALDDAIETNIQNNDQALTYCGTLEHLKQRERVHKQLQNQGVFAIDTLAKHLPAKLANGYWEIKRAGML